LDSKDYTHLTALAERLSERGYTVVRFDPTGTWDSDGDIAEYSTSQYLSDIQSVIEYMLKQGKYASILLGGHSRGGMISILYAARNPRISEVVSIMPSSLENLKAEKYKIWKDKGYRVSSRDIPNSLHRQEFKVPYSHVEDLVGFNVFEDIKKVYAPIIVVAGELDDVCLPENVKEIFDLANEPKKYILLKGIGHDYRNYPEQIESMNTKILKNI
jgi:uncharacterized protein